MSADGEAPATNPMERMIAEALAKAGIPFSTDPNQTSRLDFRLETGPVYIEVKQFHSARIAEQMGRVENVVAIQGAEAVAWFATLLSPSIAATDPVQAWLQECCVTAPVCAPNARELFPTLFDSYCAWCAVNGLTPLLASPFGTALKQSGILFAGKNNRGQRWRAPVLLKAPPHD